MNDIPKIMSKEKILFEVIISNQCNKRCSYCDLDFRDSDINNKVLDEFIAFLFNEIDNVEYFIINFFWWEPLLGFEKIKYFVEKTKLINNKLNFSIWTNGLLLANNKLSYLNKNNFNIYLSIDTEKWNTILNKKLNYNYSKTYINFIISPLELNSLDHVFKEVIDYWFININIMPAFWIKLWTTEKLSILNNFVNIGINKYKKINIKKYSYYNWIWVDKQFILETDGKIYQDLDSLLWIQKQNKSIWYKVSNYIEKNSLIWNIKDWINLKNLLIKYNIKNILNMVYIIPKKQWLERIYKKIDLIIKK